MSLMRTWRKLLGHTPNGLLAVHSGADKTLQCRIFNLIDIRSE